MQLKMVGIQAAGRTSYLGSTHPLAEVARRHCANEHDSPPVAVLGNVACGACWERAIRDDERVVVEFELPREVEVDPTYLDEIAIERACQGHRVVLTKAERAAAVARLAAKGLTAGQIADRLHTRPERLPAVIRREHTATRSVSSVAA